MLEMTDGHIDSAHFGPDGDTARHIASYCDGKARVHVYTAAFEALATTRAELAALKDTLAERNNELHVVIAQAQEWRSEAAEKDLLIHQLGENAAKAAGEYAEEVGRYKTAWQEFDKRLSWMQGHPALPSRYLGWHIADVASDMIGRAYPEFSDAITRAALTEPTDEG